MSSAQNPSEMVDFIWVNSWIDILCKQSVIFNHIGTMEENKNLVCIGSMLLVSKQHDYPHKKSRDKSSWTISNIEFKKHLQMFVDWGVTIIIMLKI